MATFTGTIDEYVRMVGPRLRNVIQGRTKPLKRQLDHVCEKCGERRELEAIHAEGHERVEIMRRVLSRFEDDDGVITVDMEQVESELVRKNLESLVGFWCHECHAKVDPKVGRYGSCMPMPGVSGDA